MCACLCPRDNLYARNTALHELQCVLCVCVCVCLIRSVCSLCVSPLSLGLMSRFTHCPEKCERVSWRAIHLPVHINASLCLFVCLFAQIYRILGKTVVCYPIVFDLSDFYLSQDVMLLIDDIKVRQGYSFGAHHQHRHHKSFANSSLDAHKRNDWGLFSSSGLENMC